MTTQTKLAGITLPSKNLERSLEFYRDVVLFEEYLVLEQAVFLATGSAPLAIYRAGNDSETDAWRRGLFLNVAVNDLDGLKNRLSTFGTSPIKEWKERNEIHVMVADPDGNLVEFEFLLAG